jgi:aspartyl-tRNA synthetase
MTLEEQLAALAARIEEQHDEVMNRFEEIGLDIHNVQGEQLRIRADFLDLRNEIRTLSLRLRRHIENHPEAA